MLCWKYHQNKIDHLWKFTAWISTLKRLNHLKIVSVFSDFTRIVRSTIYAYSVNYSHYSIIIMNHKFYQMKYEFCNICYFRPIQRKGHGWFLRETTTTSKIAVNRIIIKTIRFYPKNEFFCCYSYPLIFYLNWLNAIATVQIGEFKRVRVYTWREIKATAAI